MAQRPYRLGKRQASADQTRASILRAAQDEVAAGKGLSVGRVARKAGVSRITVYNQFGSRSGLLDAVSALVPALTDELPADVGARELLERRIAAACSAWAANASLVRHLPRSGRDEGLNRQLAERLAASDQLRAGCSIKEAEDVIGTLTSFETFDRLYKDGRRWPPAVAEILMRLASGILSDK
jgi:AcrR family transcriptional regulator